MACVLSVSTEVDELDSGIAFWEAVLGLSRAGVMTWAPGAGSAFFELPDGVRVIVNSPRRTTAPPEWLGMEFEVADPEQEGNRLRALGIEVSEVYETDGGSHAVVVTAPNGQKFRMGTRWNLPSGDTDVSAGPPQENANCRSPYE